jgi:hypothetical protein
MFGSGGTTPTRGVSHVRFPGALQRFEHLCVRAPGALRYQRASSRAESQLSPVPGVPHRRRQLNEGRSLATRSPRRRASRCSPFHRVQGIAPPLPRRGHDRRRTGLPDAAGAKAQRAHLAGVGAADRPSGPPDAREELRGKGATVSRRGRTSTALFERIVVVDCARRDRRLSEPNDTLQGQPTEDDYSRL